MALSIDPNFSAWQSENALRAQGTSSYAFTNGNTYSYFINWQDDEPNLSQSGFDTPGLLSAWPEQGTTGTVESVGKRRIRFQWVRNQINGQDDPNDDPPSSLNMVVHLIAGAEQQVEQSGGGVGNMDIETTVGIENGVSFVGIQNPFPQFDSTYGGYYYRSYIDKYIPVSISTSTIDSQGRLWSPWFTYNAKAQGDLLILAPFAEYVTLSFDWDYDTRAVEIASSVAPSYFKDGNGNPQAHTRDANGHLTVDTVATWHIADSALPIDTWVWDGTFNAVLLGAPWGAPQYQWSSSPAGLNQTVSTFPQALNLGKTTTGTKNDPVTTTNAQINLNVTDDDGRQLSNTYNMVFHKPFENPVHQAGEDIDCGTSGSGCTNDTFTPSTTSYLAAGESLTYTLTPAKYDFGATLDNIAVAADAAATVGTLLTEGEVPAPRWVKVLEIMKVASSVTSLAVGSPAPDLHPQYTGSFDDFKDAVNDQLSVGNYDDNNRRVVVPSGYTDDLLTDVQNSFAGTTASTNPFWNGIANSQNPTGIKVTFKIFPHRKNQKRFYKGDAYSNNGYVGQVTQPVVKPIVVQVEPQFKLDE